MYFPPGSDQTAYRAARQVITLVEEALGDIKDWKEGSPSHWIACVDSEMGQEVGKLLVALGSDPCGLDPGPLAVVTDAAWHWHIHKSAEGLPSKAEFMKALMKTLTVAQYIEARVGSRGRLTKGQMLTLGDAAALLRATRTALKDEADRRRRLRIAHDRPVVTAPSTAQALRAIGRVAIDAKALLVGPWAELRAFVDASNQEVTGKQVVAWLVLHRGLSQPEAPLDLLASVAALVDPANAAVPPRKRRGNPGLSVTQQQGRDRLVKAWHANDRRTRTKAQFCEDHKVSLALLNKAIDSESKRAKRRRQNPRQGGF